MRNTILLLAVLGLGACAGPVSRPETAASAFDEAGIRRELQAQHRQWRGAPYRLGGLSRRGVDCSGFVHLTFLTRFDSRLPRTTEALSESGRRVRERHVGIYLGDGRFLHASKSVGVTISDLGNPYWEDAYWQTRRVW